MNNDYAGNRPAASQEAAQAVLPQRLADSVHARVKSDLFEFRLMPGERFSENDIAARLGVSRTPVREALHRLAQEGYLDVANRSGWTVRGFDFEHFENLYDLRVVLETAAVKRLCEQVPMHALEELREAWLVPQEARLDDPALAGALDERFHATLVQASGNTEMARVHHDVTERIRIIRRLDFTSPERIHATYAEHGQILRALLRRKADAANLMLRSHIETSRAEVRKITLHRLHSLRLHASNRA